MKWKRVLREEVANLRNQMIMQRAIERSSELIAAKMLNPELQLESACRVFCDGIEFEIYMEKTMGNPRRDLPHEC